MTNINDIILELNKSEQMIAQGKVTGSNINKLQQSGAVRSVDTHLKGLDKGTDNILNKTKTTEKNGLLGKLSPVTLKHPFWGNTVHVPKKETGSLAGMIGGKTLLYSKDLTPMIRRHEADEVRDKNKTAISFMHNGKQVGQHTSPKVLQREYKHVSYLSKLNPRYAKWEKLRQNSGEYSNKILNLNARQLRKLNKTSTKHTEDHTEKLTNTFSNAKRNFSQTPGFFSKAKAGVKGLKDIITARKNVLYKYEI